MAPRSPRRAPGQFLARSAEDVSKSAPTTTEQRHPSPPTLQRKSHPPSPTYINVPNHQVLQPLATEVGPRSNGYIMQNGHVANAHPVPNHHHQQQLPIAQASVKAALVPHANGYPDRGRRIANGPQFVTPDAPRIDPYFGYPPNFQQLVVGGSGGGVRSHQNSQVAAIPRVESKGKHACPRCARRFNSKIECNDHKARCMS